MALEKWAAVASLGLYAMFAGEMVSVYHFMANPPNDFEFGPVFEANPKLLQFISIGVAPASILATLSYILSRRFGSRQSGILLVAGGAVMFAGMIYCHSLLDSIDEAYMTDSVNLVPSMFMAISAAVILVGFKLFRTKKRRPKKEYF